MYRQLLNPSVLKLCNALLYKSTSSIANNLSITSLDFQIRLPSTCPIAQSTIDNFSSLYPKEHFSFHQSATNWADSAERKPLVVLFAWLYSSDKNVHKYRELYLTRGIDVLTVRYSLGQFLFPPLWANGCKQNAVNAIRFLTQDSHYEQCIFHTLSAGCYQMIEMLVMTEPEQRQQDRARIASMMRGVILDSPLNHKTLVPGLIRTVSSSKLIYYLALPLVNGFNKLFYPISMVHHVYACTVMDQNRLQCATLLFMSKDDIIAHYEHYKQMAKEWKQRGIDVTFKAWNQSTHVSHYMRHSDEYRNCVDKFIENKLQK